MNYRIYVDDKGLKYYDTKTTEELMFAEVDELIDIYDHILVVEHNIEENYDFPLFSLYSTDKEKYLEFRKKDKDGLHINGSEKFRIKK